MTSRTHWIALLLGMGGACMIGGQLGPRWSNIPAGLAVIAVAVIYKPWRAP